MNVQSRQKNFEKAAEIRDQYFAIKGLNTKISIGDDDSYNIELDQALSQLSKTLKLSKNPKRIECYDISNISGKDAVSSMIVFTDGMPDQKQYRHFKMRTKGPNDFAMMQETLERRFSARNTSWLRPDLIIVDGGKGQLGSAKKSLDMLGIDIPICGLAKRYETIVVFDSINKQTKFLEYNFESRSPVLHLIQRIRDEAHRFAISYHKTIRKKRTNHSELDDIKGIGPKTRQKLLMSLKSMSKIKNSNIEDLENIIGISKAKIVYDYLHST